MLGRMTWTAPQITRQSAPYVADERRMLEAWLDFQRQTLLSKCSGPTAGQLRQRAAPPSTLSLLGLVRHMTDVERGWFRRRIAGEEVGYLYHMIEEYARHSGHADLLRERIDGTTGY